MTDKQINLARKQLPPRTQVPWREWTDDQKQLDKELMCRDMINSILCYGGKNNIIQNRYLQSHIEELGFETVQRLCDEQIADFEKATVLRNVHTDSEGISYNSIVWGDE